MMVYRSVRTTEAPSTPEHRAAGASPSGERAAVSGAAELAALRQEVAQLRQLVKNQGQAPAAPDQAKTEPVDPEIKALETQVEQERRHREYVQGVAASFRKEPVDPAWSSSKMSVIQTALASKPELRQLVRSVECRSQTCRVEFADEASGRPSNTVQSLLAGLGTELPTAIAERVEQAGRPGSTVFYVGHSNDIQVTVQ
jgi:transposase-like protein